MSDDRTKADKAWEARQEVARYRIFNAATNAAEAADDADDTTYFAVLEKAGAAAEAAAAEITGHKSSLICWRPWTNDAVTKDDAALNRVAESSESLSRLRCQRTRRAMASNPVWEIYERMAEVQALLHDHAECSKHTAADVVAKAQAVLSEPELLRAMLVVGYIPPNTPPIE